MAPLIGAVHSRGIVSNAERWFSMVELPRGDVSESRRGGPGVLELLLIDMRNASRSGYIRCEAPRLSGATGQITVHDGAPRLALYESPDGDLKMGHVALGAIREAALHEDSRLSLHEGVDVRLIEELHPLALLHIEEGEVIAWTGDDSDEEWWVQRQRRRTGWKRLDAWQSEDPSQPLPDAADRISPIRYEAGDELIPGMVAVVDAEEPNEVVTVARHLGEIGHPLLILTRIPPSRMEIEHGIPAQVTRWLTEKGDGSEQVLAPSLEEVRRAVDDFLHSSQRCVMVLDGAEFLSGLHGIERLLGLLRSLVDTVTSADHLLLIPCDLSAWSLKERTIMMREVDRISSSLVAEWSLRPAIVEGHPFCSDDWTPFELPEPMQETAAVAPTTEGAVQDRAEVDVDAHRFSITGLVEEWRQERSDEVAGVAETVSHAAVKSTNEDLPDWATSPSANMLEDEIQSPVQSTVQSPVQAESPVIEEELNPEPEVIVVEAEPEPIRPKRATVNHRGNAPRRVKKRRITKSQLSNRGLVGAASLSAEVGEMAVVAEDQTSRDELTSAAGLAAEVVELPEEIDYRQMDKGLTDAVKGARVVKAEVPDPDYIDLHQKSLDAAKEAAAGEGWAFDAPPLSDNPSVRESASRAQRTSRFTEWLAQQERSDLRALSGAFSGVSVQEDTIWQRIAELQSDGVDMAEVIEMFELDPESALHLLEEAER